MNTPLLSEVKVRVAQLHEFIVQSISSETEQKVIDGLCLLLPIVTELKDQCEQITDADSADDKKLRDVISSVNGMEANVRLLKAQCVAHDGLENVKH